MEREKGKKLIAKCAILFLFHFEVFPTAVFMSVAVHCAAALIYLANRAMKRGAES